MRRVEPCVTSKPCTGLYYYISVKARLVMTFLHWHFLQGQSHVRATQAVQLATHTPLITLNTHGRRLNATLTLVTFTLPLYSLPHVDRWSSSNFAEVTCLRTDEREARTGFSFYHIAYYDSDILTNVRVRVCYLCPMGYILNRLTSQLST